MASSELSFAQKRSRSVYDVMKKKRRKPLPGQHDSQFFNLEHAVKTMNVVFCEAVGDVSLHTLYVCNPEDIVKCNGLLKSTVCDKLISIYRTPLT